MIVDSFFQQGESHDVCEDYALHRQNYAIVSDGCSNFGGPKICTDWGSRFICNSAEYYLPILTDSASYNKSQTKDGEIPSDLNCAKRFFEIVGATVFDTVRMFGAGIPWDSMTATLGMVYHVNGMIHALLMGDGVIGARKRNGGNWVIQTYEPQNGGCFYLKYITMGEVESYFQNSKSKGIYNVNTFFGDIKNPLEMEKNLNVMILDPEYPFFKNSFSVEEYDLVFVGTDGWMSFYEKVQTTTSKYSQPLSAIDPLNVILDVPLYKEGFLNVQRTWAFKRPQKGSYINRNWHNSDDASLGIIYCD